jgi:hypothetical protein
MMLFTHGSRLVDSPFDLLGYGEDAITGAIAWALRQSPTLFETLVNALTDFRGSMTDARVYFQRSEKNNGRTDLEIIIPGEMHVIFEAKKGWELPGARQLGLYTRRRSFADSDAKVRMIVTLSLADQRYARLFLPDALNGIAIRHLPRRELNGILKQAARITSGHHEKMSLRTLETYLNKTMNDANFLSNQVYVVSLSRQQPASTWTGVTFVDVVERFHKYFHPVGARWPVSPPNYIGFRYDGALRSVHHVDEVVVTKDLADVAREKLPSWPVTQPQFLYTLGPAIHPPRRLPAGPKVLRSNRVWAALDLLLTAATITEAMEETKKRREAWDLAVGHNHQA